MRRTLKINGHGLKCFLWIVLIAALWEFCARIITPDNYFFPPLSEVTVTLAIELVSSNLFIQCCNSFMVVVIGIVCSCVLAFCIFGICTVSKTLESFFDTICSIMNPLPSVAVIPLAIFVFGVGNGVQIFLICHSVLWPLLKNLLTGYHGINPLYKDFFKNLQISRWGYLIHVIIPAAFGNLLMGIKIAWGRAFRALIAVEMIFGMTGNLGGLGYYIYKARANADMKVLYAGIILIALLGFLVENVLLNWVEKRTTKKWGGVN